MIYIACPYSHSNGIIRQERFNAATNYASELVRKGVLVFSPITHGHVLVRGEPINLEATFWCKLNLVVLAASTEVHVLMLDGWKDSVGIAEEITQANKLGIPVKLIHLHYK